MAACNSKPQITEVKPLQSAQQAMDTAGLAQFQQWKAQNELSTAVQPQETRPKPVEAVPVKTVEVIRERVVERPVPVRKKKTATQSVPEPAKPIEQKTESTDNATVQNDGSGSAESTTSNEAKAPATGEETAKKKGWSSTAKGAVIGGAGGAVVGAVINKKNPAVGAVIGGVLGAGAGYGIGHKKDKKDGRID